MRLSHCATSVSAVALAVVLVGQAAAIEFNEIARFDVSFAFSSDLDPDDTSVDDNPKFIGTNPLAVAWNGSKLYLGGHDNFGSSLLPIGLIEVLNPTRTGINVLSDADFGPKFGEIFQPLGRGYTGLELSGSGLAAAYDDGAASGDAIQLFDTSSNSLLWDLSDAGITGRGGSGVGFDPGFNGADATPGVAWTQFASGRRALQDPATGASEYLLGSEPLGFQWLPDSPPGSNFARDFAFDPATGDIYVRRNNDIDAADRSGDNATTNRRTIVDDPTDAGAFKLGQKIEFLEGTAEGDLLIYNDSVVASTDQPFVDVVKVVDTDGVAKTATFNLLGGLTGADIADGAGIYDFDYDPISKTLAVVDFVNRNVFIFGVGSGGEVLVGDYNDDGVVDAADYTVWRDSEGVSVTLPGESPDATTPGLVDAEDYAFWQANYGAAAAGSLNGAAAPEPTGLAIAGTLASLILCGRRRDCAT
ncbi:hypothetical protein Pla123a_11800 [Posidoniimonas polymericola]|uniref:PEP-CTERM protein-sorting domain-containing protein n=1 Tax=Posidoniimonas polymericola TaxID=2528002 RepID=A0A5C5YTR7_9BACT|nr:hypothetical protein [Posidoniimonas polymericola]TWT78389.1 hypothetical protein Pla123a_11800 [Posidoniimonas polymericola]